MDVEVSEERHFDPGDHFERVELAFEDGELRKGSEADSVLDIWDRINWKMMSLTPKSRTSVGIARTAARDWPTECNTDQEGVLPKFFAEFFGKRAIE